MSKILAIAVLVAVLSHVECGRPTHCALWSGNKDFRCAKDDFRADRVSVRNIANAHISFKVGKWLSTCGQSGNNYADNTYYLAPGDTHYEGFSEVGNNKCNEMFIYECRVSGRGADCLNAIVPSPA